MTVNISTSSISYDGNGVLTTFAYPFKILATDEILVIIKDSSGVETTLTLDVDYTVTGAGGTGGTVVLTDATDCPTGAEIHLIRNTDLLQETDYVDGEGFSAGSVETALDKLALKIQDQNTALSRALSFPKTFENISNEISGAEFFSRASKILGFNSSGNLATFTASSPITVVQTYALISSYASLDAAVTAIGGANTTLLLDASTTMVGNVTIPANIILVGNVGSLITLTSGKVLTFASQPIFGDYQTFTGSGTVTGLSVSKPDWWKTNATPGTTDMTTAVQSAITCAIDSDGGVVLSTGLYKLTASVDIDRQVDGAAFDKYFTISSENDSGFVVGTAIAMFSSSIAFTTAPVSQLVQFRGVTFSSTNASLAAYVLDDAIFLRTRFVGCNFQKIKLLSAPTVHIQSISVEGCNIRRFEGTFLSAQNYSYDFKFINNIVEAGENAIDITQSVGTAIIGNNIEGMSGTAIKLNGSQSTAVHGNYFESNGLDIDNSGVNVAYGFSLTGNYFADAAVYSVLWGDVLGSISAGNWHTGSMHSFTTAIHDIVINDIAQTSLSDITNTPVIKTGFSGTYTATLTGCTTSPTGTARYEATGNTVTIYFPQINGTSNTTAATLTGMPADIRPTRQQIVAMRTTDNGTVSFGIAVIDTDGVITLGKNALGDGFTNSGTKGNEVFTITYSLT